MTATVRWERQAIADREDIYRYLYQNAGLEVANATDDKFAAAVALLETTPEAGVSIGKSGERRKLVLARLPFILVYALKRHSGDVHILRLLHTARDISARYRSR
ncbi:type II toxin-antitoxin system RelE/ParE family toxin [Dickeya solani]|uniref:Type II toxin-antitoxin system RelE/ParE family toxin n=1 Tax=Dickeya solani TaxID=1089444 RepID=A0AAX4EYB5_9GAMM|nr:type II toxin-antitoxin system RelE/ParE family toxin [Dickeya solani]WOA52036.1 type II toxin-antitoxin system RelE/ParE family toxin [Dickeya solani]